MSNSSLVSYTNISPNKNSPRNHAIDTITIHCVVGQLSAKTICDMFKSRSAGASCNYAIGKDGEIGLCVEEKDRSWCSSNGENDNRAITIECASDMSHPYAINAKVYNSVVNLCADICERNGIQKLMWEADKSLIGQVDKQNMTVHRWFANKACPGDYIYERLGQIADAVNEKLGASSTSTRPTTPSSNNEVNSFPAVPFTVKVLIDDLNYRSEPSMSGDAKGYTGKGTFTITEVRNGWGKLKSGAGWIWLKNPSYCTVRGTTASSSKDDSDFQVKITATNLRIRKGPGTNYDFKDYIDKGVYTITEVRSGSGSKTGWGKLKSGVGWISLDYATRI